MLALPNEMERTWINLELIILRLLSLALWNDWPSVAFNDLDLDLNTFVQ